MDTKLLLNLFISDQKLVEKALSLSNKEITVGQCGEFEHKWNLHK